MVGSSINTRVSHCNYILSPRTSQTRHTLTRTDIISGLTNMLFELCTVLLGYYRATVSVLTWSVVLQVVIGALISRIIYTQFLLVYISPLRHLPSTNFVPIVGCIPKLMCMEANEYHEKWMKTLNAPVFRFFALFGQERITVADADVIKHILVTKAKLYKKTNSDYFLTKQILGNGLVTSEDDIHRKNRKICNGSFKISILKNMIPVFDQGAKSLIDMWLEKFKTNEDKEATQEADVQENMSKLALDAIGKCAFNYNFDSLQHCSNDVTESVMKLMRELKISWYLILHKMFPSLRTKHVVNLYKQIENLDKVVYSLIKKKKENLDKNCDESKVTDLLTSLLLAKYKDTGDTMDDKQLRDEVVTFMLAGHETTSTVMTWCLLQMARYPHIQNKVREEVQSVLPLEGEPITFDHLEKLTYLTCVIQETMRLYPPVPRLSRTSLEDNTIEGYVFPKGVIAEVNVGLLHKNPKYWQEPEEFRPERFEDISQLYPCSYIPFLVGSRMCIGYKFAMMEMQIGLASLIKKFEFSPLPGITYKRIQMGSMKPNPELKLNIKEI